MCFPRCVCVPAMRYCITKYRVGGERLLLIDSMPPNEFRTLKRKEQEAEGTKREKEDRQTGRRRGSGGEWKALGEAVLKQGISSVFFVFCF